MKTVLITGGAGGAGRATAELFAAQGSAVGIADRNAEAGTRLAKEIESHGGRAFFVEADVASSRDIDNSVAQTQSRLGPIDTLVNHAGTVIVKRLIDMSDAEWDDLMATNVRSMFAACRAVLPGMIERRHGVIVNTCSISSFTVSPFESAYCASKGACLQLTRAIACEYREYGIRCNAVCPGFIDTDHGQREIRDLMAAGVDVTLEGIGQAQQRMCTPREVGEGILFLASEQASFINGAALVIDNGSTIIT